LTVNVSWCPVNILRESKLDRASNPTKESRNPFSILIALLHSSGSKPIILDPPRTLQPPQPSVALINRRSNKHRSSGLSFAPPPFASSHANRHLPCCPNPDFFDTHSLAHFLTSPPSYNRSHPQASVYTHRLAPSSFLPFNSHLLNTPITRLIPVRVRRY